MITFTCLEFGEIWEGALRDFIPWKHFWECNGMHVELFGPQVHTELLVYDCLRSCLLPHSNRHQDTHSIHKQERNTDLSSLHEISLATYNTKAQHLAVLPSTLSTPKMRSSDPTPSSLVIIQHALVYIFESSPRYFSTASYVPNMIAALGTTRIMCGTSPP